MVLLPVFRLLSVYCLIFFYCPFTVQLPGITNIGTYYYDDPVRHRNGEFDVALAFGDQYRIYETKYDQKPLALSEIHKEAGQIREIEALNVVQLGFIAVNGFEKQEDGYSYYSGEDLYR